MEKLYKLIEVSDKDGLDTLYNASAMTFTDLGAEEEDLLFFVNWLEKAEVKPKMPLNIYVIKGSTMNREYGLTRSNAYPDDWGIVSIMHDKDIGDSKKLRAAQMTVPGREQVGTIGGDTPMWDTYGRWFDDIVDNNADRELNFKLNALFSRLYDEYIKINETPGENKTEFMQEIIDAIEEEKKEGNEDGLLEQRHPGLYSQFFEEYWKIRKTLNESEPESIKKVIDEIKELYGDEDFDEMYDEDE